MTKTTPKIEYSEHEAATMLGVSIDQLRSMIRNHIVKDEAAGAPSYVDVSSFRSCCPSDPRRHAAKWCASVTRS